MFRYANELARLYGSDSAEPAFADLIARFDPHRDEEIADLIEADGRLRIRLNRPVTIDRYRSSIPDITERTILLDTAIDMALRSLARTGHADEDSIGRLIRVYPDLADFIRETAALNSVVWSTQHVQHHVTRVTIPQLPASFGPVGEDGVQRYELRELLGEGAFGQVFLAIDRQLSEDGHPAFVSIKVLAGEERSGWARQQLIDEATKARRVDHPNVARVLDRGVSTYNRDFIVYEYVNGGDLARWIRRRPGAPEVSQVVLMVAKIARGVHAAHMAGLVHCDIKPSNIILTREEEPKVSDFGIAIRAEEPGSRARHRSRSETEPLGNLAFMAPEQYRIEDGALTIPADIYALGGILFWLLTGVLPNGGTAEEIAETHDSTRGRSEAPCPRRYQKEIDGDLAAICRRAMAVLPSDRHASAAAMADDLEAWLRREPIPWTHPTVVRRAALWGKRKPALAGAALLITLLLVGTGGTIVHSRSLMVENVLAEARADQEAARAEQEKARREREQQRANFQEDVRQNGLERVQGIKRALLGMREEAKQSALWWPLLVLETPWEGTVVSEGADLFHFWPKRFELVQKRLSDQSEYGTERHLRALLWETMLCYWLVNSHQVHRDSETLQRIAALRERFGQILDAQDPWLEQLEAIELCARLQLSPLHLASAAPVPAAVREQPSVESIAARLEPFVDGILWQEPYSPLVPMIAEHLVMSYGPDLLDVTQSRERWVARLDDIKKRIRDKGNRDYMMEDHLWMNLVMNRTMDALRSDVGLADRDCDRIRFTRSYVDAAQVAGEGGHLRTLMWESYLCFWLTSSPDCEEQAGEAGHRIAQLKGELGRRLAADDPWLEYLETLGSCVRIHQLSTQGTLDEAARTQLRAEAQALARIERELYASEPQSRLERVVVAQLERAYGPTMLNEPERAAFFTQRLGGGEGG